MPNARARKADGYSQRDYVQHFVYQKITEFFDRHLGPGPRQRPPAQD